MIALWKWQRRDFQATLSHVDSKGMDARLFALVSADNPTLVFAWGMEITHRDDTEAVIYRHDPRTGQSLTGVHNSAEAALARWSRCDRWSCTGRSTTSLAA